MQITIKWNDNTGEAELAKASKKMLEKRLAEQSGEMEHDVVLCDFLIDCAFIIDRVRAARTAKKKTFTC